MLKKILQTKHQMPTKLTNNVSFKGRQSEISLTNSVCLSSFQNIDNQKPRNNKKQSRVSQMIIPKNSSRPVEYKEEQKQKRQILEQKMQNVSCLYSNFIYKNSQKNFIDDMKLQRYRIMVQNQRTQKNQLLKQVEQMKQKITNTEKQKQTVLFAYRALQAKIKEKQLRAKLRLKSQQRRQKLSINMTSKSGNQLEGSNNSLMFQNQLMKSRQLLTSQGILSLNENEQSQEFMQSARKLCSSKSICKYLQNKDGIKEWQQKQKKFIQMETQLTQLKQKYQEAQVIKTNLQQQNTTLTSQVQFYKEEFGKAVEKLDQLQDKISQLNEKISKKQYQNDTLQSKLNQINLKYVDQEKQAKRKAQIIKELQDTKYTYLMKEQKEKQQIQLLKKFTQNLQLNDQKINEFIHATFGNQVQSTIQSQRKVFKQDLSYILHLIKKKQNIYNQLIHQYQEKHRQSQTRCFLIEKKLHLTDIFVKKLEDITSKQLKDQKQNSQIKVTVSKNSIQKTFSHQEKLINIKNLKNMIESYKLDLRII